MGEPRSDWRGDLALIALPGLAVFVYYVVGSNVVLDGDTFGHVATGRWILGHGRVPSADPFSFSAFGRHWVTQEWLSQVVLFLAYAAGGWSGLTVLTAACAAAVVSLLAAELRKCLGTLSVLATIGLSFALLQPCISARPHMITLPLMVIWMIALLDARRRDRAPPLWLLPLMILWANLHGGFILGLAFTGFFALEAFMAARTRGGASLQGVPANTDAHKASLTQRVGAPFNREIAVLVAGGAPAAAAKWGAFLIGAAIMAMFTPNGVEGLFYPIHHMSLKLVNLISEWDPVDFQNVFEKAVMVFNFSLFICLYRGVKIPAVRLSLLIVLINMTFQHVRQEAILAAVGPLLLAEPLAAAFEPKSTSSDRAVKWPSRRALAVAMLGLAMLFLAAATWRLARPTARGDSDSTPVSALAHVPAALLARPMFNDFGFGGWMILSGLRPFMDSRTDMYGDDLFKLYLDAEQADPAAVATVFGRYDIDWTILRPSSDLARRLDVTPGWRRLYADKWAVIHVRQPTPPAWQRLP